MLPPCGSYANFVPQQTGRFYLAAQHATWSSRKGYEHLVDGMTTDRASINFCCAFAPRSSTFYIRSYGLARISKLPIAVCREFLPYCMHIDVLVHLAQCVLMMKLMRVTRT